MEIIKFLKCQYNFGKLSKYKIKNKILMVMPASVVCMLVSSQNTSVESFLPR